MHTANMPHSFILKLSLKQSLPAFIAILALFSSLQIEGYNYSIRWFLLTWFLLLSLILGKLFVSYDTPLPLPLNKPFWSFSAFLAWATLSISWSAVPGETLLVAMTFTSCLFGILLGFWADKDQWRYFCNLLKAIAIITVGYTAWQRYALDIKRPTGFLLNWNTNSAFIAVILLPNCALFLNRAKQQHTLLLPGLFIALCAFGMSLGQSRGALAGFLLGLGILLLSAWQMRYGIKAIALLLAIIIAGYISADLLNDSAMIERLGKVTQLNEQVQKPLLESIGSGRHALWDAGWRMYLEKPWLGWGLGMYHNLYPQYRPPLLQELGMYAHNDYLQFLLELGPIGLLLSLAFVISVLHSGLKLYLINGESTEKLQHLGLLAGCVALLSHSLVTFNLYQASLLMILGLYLGQTTKHNSTSKQIQIKPATAMTRGGYFSILGSSSALLSLWALSIFVGFQSVQKSFMTPNPQQQFQYLRQASQYLPFLDEFQSRQVMLILGLLSTKSAQTKLNEQEIEQFTDYALEQAEQAIKNNPLRYINFSNKAEVLYVKSKHGDNTINPNDIIDNFKHSIEIDPYRLKIRLMLADYYADTGDEKKLREVLLDGLNRTYAEEYQIGMDFLLKLQKILQSPSDTTVLNNIKQLKNKQKKLINSPYISGPFTLKID